LREASRSLSRFQLPRLFLLLALGLAATSCSIKKMAANGVANTLTSGPDVYGTDEDPELVRAALPFGLKTLESLLQILPEHRGLLLTSCRGFTQYGYAFVQLDAERLEPSDYSGAADLRRRALSLFLRARGYGIRGLELDYRGIGEQLRTDPQRAASRLRPEDVPMLYWTAAAWGSAINLGKDQPELLGDLAAVRALMERGIVLDEAWDGGTLHEAMIQIEALPPAMGGSVARARRHFDRAIALSQGRRASPYVTLATSVSVAEQNRSEFESLLQSALAVDPASDPSQRLANVVLQRRARALLDRAEELFLDADTSKTKESR
jgi:predicted anti-sigma-YlaC factor YlaD